MGGERASKTRQRERGDTCWRCSEPLPPPRELAPGSLLQPTPTRQPGYRANERLCDRCQHIVEAKAHTARFRVVCNMSASTWSVHFVERPIPDVATTTRIGPWLLRDSENDLTRILRWATPRGRMSSRTGRRCASGVRPA